MRQVDEAVALIKDEEILINQLETKVQDLEDENNLSEADVAKECKIWIA